MIVTAIRTNIMNYSHNVISNNKLNMVALELLHFGSSYKVNVKK